MCRVNKKRLDEGLITFKHLKRSFNILNLQPVIAAQTTDTILHPEGVAGRGLEAVDGAGGWRARRCVLKPEKYT